MGKGKGLGDVAKLATWNGWGGAVGFDKFGMPTEKKSKSPGPRLDMSRFDWQDQADERVKQSREASLGLMTDLQKQAKGEGPSLAGAQLKSASDRNLAQTLAAASAQRGGNPALAQRNIMQQKGQADRQVAEQSALARMQEQASAQQQLASLSQAQQGQDLAQVAGPQQALAQYEAMRFAADVARRNAVKQQQNEVLGQGMGAASSLMSMFAASDERLKIPLDRPASEIYEDSLRKFTPEKKEKDSSAGKGLGSSLGGMFGGKKTTKSSTPEASLDGSKAMGGGLNISSMLESDEDNKKPAESAKVNPKKDIKDFLDKLEARSFVYKNPEGENAAPGKRYGIMAQDLEKSEVGKTFVKDTEQGKMVDTVQGFGAVLAAQAELNNRLKKLEKGKK